jgi:ribosomal protein S18 acetylase RimI-like enzyme
MPLEIRPAGPDDAYDIVRINVHAWQKAYAGIVPEDVLAAMDIDRRTERQRRRLFDEAPFRTLMAVHGGSSVGYVHFGPYRDGEQLNRAAGEIVAIYVQPGSWGTGAGRTLLGEALASLAEQGLTEVRLWVLEANQPARRFYQIAGFIEDGGRASYPVRRPDGGVVDLDEIRYTRRG